MKILILFCLPVLLYSCAAPIESLTKTQYTNPEFNEQLLQDGGLALLPVTAGQAQQGYKRPLGDFLNQDLQSAVPDGDVLKWQDTMELLNKNSKVRAYEDMIVSYRETSIVSSDIALELKDALNVRYVLYCYLQDYSEKKETTVDSFSDWKTIKTANALAHCLIIDLQTGNIMQEISGHAMSTEGTFSHNQEYEEFAKTIAHSILSQIPGADIPPIK